MQQSRFLVDRRWLTKSSLALFAPNFGAILEARAAELDFSTASVAALRAQFDQTLLNFQTNEAFVDAMRAAKEAMVGRPPKSSTPISAKATDFIIAAEVSSQQVYTAKYQQPTWPGGASGVTVGIGYDFGDVTPDNLKEDWQGYIPDGTIAALAPACGLSGTAAQQMTQKLKNAVTIPWSAAYTEYMEQVQPRYVGGVEQNLPNTGLLNQDCLGALVSLAYNRGYTAFNNSGDRYTEMRAIKADMQSKSFSDIPAQIRSMERLWINIPGDAGLVARREAEAALFAAGLKEQ
jgi:GH24 family phage-related lysozyme (muramidase)